MRLHRRKAPYALLLLRLVACISAESPPSIYSSNLAARDSIGRSEPDPAITASSQKSTSAAHRPDAPVDGKDGLPHAGPFVETAAERDRKKAKESGDDTAPGKGRKPAPKSSESLYTDEEGRPLKETNDGVMDDPTRKPPKEGTRGTEGGITEKEKERKAQEKLPGPQKERKPEEPKEAPALVGTSDESPDEEIIKGSAGGKKSTSEPSSDGKADSTPEELGGLKKPADLPEKPIDVPPPLPANAAKDHLEITKPTSPKTPQAEADGISQPLHSFVLAFIMIIFSEIGDKTFIVAALMAMKHPPLLVFSAAFPALLLMTILSAVLGHVVPSLLSPRITNFAAAVLFLVFGAKMMREGYSIAPDEGIGAEMREVEMELEEKEALARKLGRRRSSITPHMLESGRDVNGGMRTSRPSSRLPAPPASPPSSPDSRSPSPSRSGTLASLGNGFYNLSSLLLSPAWVQTFVMTFLGEWGDRSQIATIAMAAGQDYWWVSSGALIGHSLCTAVAVIGGRAIAGRVSLRVVTLGGAFAFLAFGLIYLVDAVFKRA